MTEYVRSVVVDLISNIAIAVTVYVIMRLLDAPTWAAVGAAMIVYTNYASTAPLRRKLRLRDKQAKSYAFQAQRARTAVIYRDDE